jgi:hypothetical protein
VIRHVATKGINNRIKARDKHLPKTLNKFGLKPNPEEWGFFTTNSVS